MREVPQCWGLAAGPTLAARGPGHSRTRAFGDRAGPETRSVSMATKQACLPPHPDSRRVRSPARPRGPKRATRRPQPAAPAPLGPRNLRAAPSGPPPPPPTLLARPPLTSNAALRCRCRRVPARLPRPPLAGAGAWDLHAPRRLLLAAQRTGRGLGAEPTKGVSFGRVGREEAGGELEPRCPIDEEEASRGGTTRRGKRLCAGASCRPLNGWGWARARGGASGRAGLCRGRGLC